MEVKNFKCNNCKKKYPVSIKAYFKTKEVCQRCWYKLKREQKSKLFKEK